MEEKRLLVMIPCLNEEMTIGDVVARVPRKISGLDRIDILIVDDGSTDNTVEIAERAGAQCISHLRNRGVGAAFRTGLAHARVGNYDYFVNIDGDGQFAPENILDVLAPVLSRQADMATASRFKDRNLVPVMPAIKRWGNRRIANLVSLFTGQRLFDVSCGFRAYNRDVIRELSLLGDFTYTHEVLLQCIYRNFRVVEVPVPVRGVREYGDSRVASSLFNYARQTLSIISATVFDHRPFFAFLCISSVFFLAGAVLAIFFVHHRITTGAFAPHIWAGFSAAYLFGIGMITILFGQVSIMTARLHRVTKNEIEVLNQKISNLQDQIAQTKNIESSFDDKRA